MAKYLVTGGAGFIGSHIVDALVNGGEMVRVLDNVATGKRENLADSWRKIEFVEGSVADAETMRRAMEGIDYVLHQAALPSVPRSVEDPLASNEANVVGTLNVLVAARDAGVKRVVYASSSSVYGDSSELPKREDVPTNPLSPYAVSKLAGENYCRAFWNVYGLETVALCYFNVFGPRQDPDSQYAAVIPEFIRAILQGDAPIIFGDGTQSRDFAFVANVVEANLKACQASDIRGGSLNIACGERHSLLGLVNQLGLLLDKAVVPQLVAKRTGDVQHSLAAITLARKALGYQVRVPFAQGLRQTLTTFG